MGDLRASSNASSVTISWTAPFSLDVTGVGPDIWYSVLIYNVTDENNPTAILCTDCINITETHYTFTPDYLSPCHVYNFSVIPVNGAGQGESSPLVTGYILNCKYVHDIYSCEWCICECLVALVAIILHVCTAKLEGLLLLLCGYLSFIVGNIQVIIQLYRSSTMNYLCRDVFYMTASQSCMLLIIVKIQNMKLK